MALTQTKGKIFVYDDPHEWAAQFADQAWIAMDTETTGLELWCTIRTIQVGLRDGRVFILDCRGQKPVPRTGIIPKVPNWHPPLNEPWGPIIFAATRGKGIIFHNSPFDLSRITTMFGIELFPPGTQHMLWDTLMVERDLNSGMMRMSHDLQETVKRRCQTFIPKGLATSFAYHAGPWRDDQLEYMADDVRYLHRVMDAQQLPIKALGLENIIDIDLQCLPGISRMEVRGFHLSADLWKVARDAAYERAHAFEHDATKLFAPIMGGIQDSLFGFAALDVIRTLNSPQKLTKMFEKIHGLKLDSVDKTTLKILRQDYELAALVVDYRAYFKFAKDFGDGLLKKIDPWGMIHPTVDPIKKTGRMGMRDPNLQQIPKKTPTDENIRACFTAPDGYVCVVADYSQMELRALADISGDEVMLKVFQDGIDLHTFTAHRIYGVPMDDVTKEQRNMAKTTNFSIVYGIMAMNLSRQLSVLVKRHVPKEEAQELIDGFHALYPQASAWLDAQHEAVWTYGFVRTPLGRIRWFDIPRRDDPDFGLKMSRFEREAANQPVQGANADATKESIGRLYTELDTLGSWISNVVHDELVAYAPVVEDAEDPYTIAKQVAKLMERAMQESAERFLLRVPIEAEPAPPSGAWVK